MNRLNQKSKALLLVFSIYFLSGCDVSLRAGDSRDMTHHFWSQVGGTYYSPANQHYLELDRQNKTAKLLEPIAGSEDENGRAQCFVYVEAKVLSVGNDGAPLFSCYRPSDILARMKYLGKGYEIHGSAGSEQLREICETGFNRYSWLGRWQSGNDIYMNINAYSKNRILLGVPRVQVLFGCDDVDGKEIRGFGQEAKGAYSRIQD